MLLSITTQLSAVFRNLTTSSHNCKGMQPLTERSYQHSIELLAERFGQPHKLINTHMQALLDLPTPTSSLNSLRLFYDTIATHTRAIESWGKSWMVIY